MQRQITSSIQILQGAVSLLVWLMAPSTQRVCTRSRKKIHHGRTSVPWWILVNRCCTVSAFSLWSGYTDNWLYLWQLPGLLQTSLDVWCWQLKQVQPLSVHAAWRNSGCRQQTGRSVTLDVICLLRPVEIVRPKYVKIEREFSAKSCKRMCCWPAKMGTAMVEVNGKQQ